MPVTVAFGDRDWILPKGSQRRNPLPAYAVARNARLGPCADVARSDRCFATDLGSNRITARDARWVQDALFKPTTNDCGSRRRTQAGRVANLKRNAPERIPNGLVTHVEQIIHEFQRRLTAIQ